MARVDDYIKALELAKIALHAKDPKVIAQRSGAEFIEETSGKSFFSIGFLNRSIHISWPEMRCSTGPLDEELPIQQQVLLLHYLNIDSNVKMAGQWIAYQEIPDGKFYMDAFVRRAKNPMVSGFGNNPELLMELATRTYGATPLEQGDVAVKIQALPLVPVALIVWKGDDEFPPEGTILFDRSVSELLSAEDIAWLAGMIIYPLLGMARTK